MVPKAKNCFRLFSKNPQGITIDDGGNLPAVLQELEESQVDMYLGPETQLCAHFPGVDSKVNRLCRARFGRKYKVVLGSSSTPYPNSRKYGGVMALLTGNSTGRVLEMGSDSMGRWVYMRLNGGRGRIITVVCTYQVGKKSVKAAGDETAIAQQWSMMKQSGRHEPHRLRHHHSRDLVNFVKECQTKGEHVVVGGDFNDTTGENDSGLTRLCSECGLQDPQFETHGHTNFKTHIKGSKCIDYILLDEDLMPSVKACGYDPFGIRIVSDHRGVYVDVHESMFFGNVTSPPQEINPRTYKSNDMKRTKKYFAFMEEHLNQHTGSRESKSCRKAWTKEHQIIFLQKILTEGE